MSAESFFEPWDEDDRGDVVDCLDGFVAEFLSERSKRRAISCTNALAGIPNPEAVRELIEAAKEWSTDPNTTSSPYIANLILIRAIEALSAPSASPQQK